MSYFFIGGFALLGALAVYQYLRKMERGRLMRGLRWVLGGGAALLAVGLLLLRRIDIAIFVAAAAVSILRRGRLGSFSFDGGGANAGNISKVQSYRFAMELDHDTGAVTGRVLNGQFAGADLIDLDEYETRILLAEVEADADSLSLLESWLDANRAGWREYFAEEAARAAGDQPAGESSDPLEEAYAVLGLKPGASDDEVRAAHRELMKGVHPDHGGSSYLASKINAARDRLLQHNSSH
jgi:hypothetical protein